MPKSTEPPPSTAAGAVTVSATAQPEASGFAAGLAGGTLAVGASLSTVKAIPTLIAVGGGTIRAGSLSVTSTLSSSTLGNAALQALAANLPISLHLQAGGANANAIADGSAGGLIGVVGTNASAETDSSVHASIAAAAMVTVSGAVIVSSIANTNQQASANEVALGLVAAGAAISSATSKSGSKSSTLPHGNEALVGDGASVNAGSLSVNATQNDTNFAFAGSGSGGVLAGAAAAPTTSTTTDTLAAIGTGANVDLSGDGNAAYLLSAGDGVLKLSAANTATVNTQVIATGFGFLSGAGATAANTIVSTVLTSFGDRLNSDGTINGASTVVRALSIQASATNTLEKPELSNGAANINGDTAGLASAAGGTDKTIVTFVTTTEVGSSADVEVEADVQSLTGAINPSTGLAYTPGTFSLTALNDLEAYDQVTFKTGGAISGASALAEIENTFGGLNANVVIGANATLVSPGTILMAANGKGNVTTNVSADTYGAVTASDTITDTILTPVNSITVGAGASITAYGDIRLDAGVDASFSQDVWNVTAHTDAYAGALIPIQSVNATATINQTSAIDIASGANLLTAGSAYLWTNHINIANTNAYAKGTNWASSAADGILDALGGDSAASYAGTGKASGTGTITVDGQVQTGINRNITLTFQSYNPAIPAANGQAGVAASAVVYNPSNLKYGFGSQVQASAEFAEYQDAVTQLATYQNSGNTQLITFYQNAVSRLETDLLSQGLAEYQTDSSGNHQIEPVQSTALTIEVYAINAAAGQIDLRANTLYSHGNTTTTTALTGNGLAPNAGGTGLLYAPTDVSITILNQTSADLIIDSITVPQLTGGVYLNGVGTNVVVTPMITISNVYNGTVDSLTSGLPNIEIRNVTAVAADLTVNSQNSISVTGSINVKTPVLNAAGDVTITSTPGQIEYVGGSSASNLAYLTPNNGLSAANTAAIAARIATLPTTPSIYGSTVTINATYIDVDGIIQAGRSNYELDLDSSVAQQIANNTGSAAFGLNVNSTDFQASYDPSTNEITVSDLRVHAGLINIKGEIFSTSAGQLEALGGYANVTINNTTGIPVVVHTINASDYGLGTIEITDTNFLDAQGNALQTKYVYSPTSGEIVTTAYVSSFNGTQVFVSKTNSQQLAYVDSSTGTASFNDVKSGQKLADQNASDYTVETTPSLRGTASSYDPEANARFGWEIEETTDNIQTTTTSTSNWAGIIPLGSNKAIFNNVPEVIEQAHLVPSSSYFYVDTASQEAADGTYTFSTHQQQIGDTIYAHPDHHETSTWYGKHTYYDTYTAEHQEAIYANHTIRADNPIGISFFEGTASNIAITSNAAVVITGQLTATGTVAITSTNGSITQASQGTAPSSGTSSATAAEAAASAIVTGHDIVLSAATGIGSAQQAFQVQLTTVDGKVGTAVTGGVTATTTSAGAPIYIYAARGDLAIRSVSTVANVSTVGTTTINAYPVVSLSALGNIYADTGSLSYNGNTYAGTGLVTGGSVTLNAAGGAIGTSTASIKLAGGQYASDVFNASALGTIYLDETGGDLHVFSIASATSDVHIQIDAGSLINYNTNVIVDTRDPSTLASTVWSQLSLTGTAAAQKVATTLVEYQTSEEQQYQTYWQYRNDLVAAGTYGNASALVTMSSANAAAYTKYYESQGMSADDAATAITTLEISMTQAYHNLAAVFGPGGTYATSGLNLYAPISASNVTAPPSGSATLLSNYTTTPTTAAYDPDTYNANFVYLLTQSEATHIVSGIKVWTATQLLTSISAGLLKTVTSTQDKDEAPNITGNHIYLTVGQNIGSLTAPVGFVAPGPTGTLSTAATNALAYAELTDVSFLSAAPVTETVNFGSSVDGGVTYPSVTIASGTDTWSPALFAKGASVYVTGGSYGTTLNATQDNNFLVVDHVSADGKTIYFAPGSVVYSESFKTVQVAPAVTDLSDKVTLTPGTAFSGSVNFGNVANNGTITLASGTNMSAFTAGEGLTVTGTSTTDGNYTGTATPYYTITAVSGTTITLDWGQVFFPENNVAVTLTPETITTVSGAAKIAYVEVNQIKDIAVQATSTSTPVTLTTVSGGFTYIGTPFSESQVSLDYAVAGTGGISAATPTSTSDPTFGSDLRIRTKGVLVAIDSGFNGANVIGSNLVLEAGNSGIGVVTDNTFPNLATVGAPVVVQVIDSASGQGSLTARAAKDINIEGIGNLPVGGIYSSSGGIYLSTIDNGSIYDQIQSDFAKIQANDIVLDAAGAIGYDAGGNLTTLHIDLIGTVGLRAAAHGSVSIDQTAGNLDVLYVGSTTGDVALEAYGSLVNAGNLYNVGAIKPGASGDIANLSTSVIGTSSTVNGVTTFTPSTIRANVVGNNVTLNSDQGGIGSASTYFNIISAASAAGTVSVLSGASNIYLDEVLSVGVSYNTTSDIALYVVSAGTINAAVPSTAFITAEKGSIYNGRVGTDTTTGKPLPILKAGSADLVAAVNVGTSAAAIVSTSNGTVNNVATTFNIAASATTGDIWLVNEGALQVGGVPGTDVSPSAYALYAPKGTVHQSSMSPITVSQNSIGAQAVVIQAGSTYASDDNLIVNPGIILQSTTSYVQLGAGNNIQISTGAQLLAATYVAIKAGDLNTAPGMIVAPGTETVEIDPSVAITAAGGSITIAAGSNVSIAGNIASVTPAGTAITAVAAAVLNASTTITILGGYSSDQNDASGTFDGTNAVLTLGGSYTAPGVITTPATAAFSIQTGGGADDIEFHPTVLAANTSIQSGAGNDLIHLSEIPTITATNSAAVTPTNPTGVDTISLDGQDGADSYVIDTTGTTSYIVNVKDSGALDTGVNTLTINGLEGRSNTFLVRPYFVAALGDVVDPTTGEAKLDANGNPVLTGGYERINYDETITNRLDINGNDRADYFYLDGNSAVMTIDGEGDNDYFQIGQVYSQNDFNFTTSSYLTGTAILNGAVGALYGGVGALLGNGLNLNNTTVGELSDGVDKATVIYGGTGDDTFTVYSNKADLSLFGEAGDDNFVVRAFLQQGSVKVDGGDGNDHISYNVDAPVDIDGGTGFNTLTLLGTEANDSFVITKDGVFGGGLNVSYTNIQAITVDGLEGDDTFYVLSTPQDVTTTLIGGTGGDTFVVGGNVEGTIVSQSTTGSSSVINHSTTSTDANYQNLFVDGIGVSVGGSGSALVTPNASQTTVHANDTTSTASFTVAPLRGSRRTSPST